jgi:hypothetical protein
MTLVASGDSFIWGSEIADSPNEQPRGFYQWALEHKYELAPKDKHPLECAHYDAALLMKGKFNELVKKNLQQNSIRNKIPQKT